MDSGCVCVSIPNDSDTTPLVSTEKECFICREAEKKGHEELQNFCDCKELVVHHQCLLTWILKGSGNKERQRCSLCTAEYHLQEGTIWRKLVFQRRSLMVFVVTLAAVIAIPCMVYYLNALLDPHPHQLFKVVVALSGVLAETLLVKCFLWYCSGQYMKARASSYSIKARSKKESRQPSPGAHNAVTRMEAEQQTAVAPKAPLCGKLSV